MLPINAFSDSSTLTVKSSVQNSISEDEDIDRDEDIDEDDDVCTDTEEATSLPAKIETEDQMFSFLDRPQEFISSGVEGFAKIMDEFFSEDKVYYDSSGSYLKLTLDTTRDNNGDMHYNSDLSLKVQIPHTKEKMKLIVQSNAEKRPDDIIIKTDQTKTKIDDKKTYSLGVEGALGKEEGWKINPQIGMPFNSDVNIFVKLKLSKKYQFKKWISEWKETAYWNRTTENGFDSSYELNRKISDDDLFRATTFARWTTATHYYDMSQTFAMYHTLSKRRAVSYYVAGYGISEPTVYATQYVIGANYRQNIHKDYLFFELIPQILYQKVNDFRAEYSLTFRIEMIFKK